MISDAEHDHDAPPGLVRLTVESTMDVVIGSTEGHSLPIPSAALPLLAETLMQIAKCGPFRGSMEFEFVPGAEGDE